MNTKRDIDRLTETSAMFSRQCSAHDRQLLRLLLAARCDELERRLALSDRTLGTAQRHATMKHHAFPDAVTDPSNYTGAKHGSWALTSDQVF